jgi:hypothetical protein
MHRPLQNNSSDSDTPPLQKRIKIETHPSNTNETPLTQMHSSMDVEPTCGEVLLELGLLITEGRKPTISSPKGFEEGPHCLRHLQKGPRLNHVCTAQNHLVSKNRVNNL